MSLTLLLPGLLLPGPALHDCVHDLALPALARLLGAARRTQLPALDTQAALARVCALAELPAAPLRLLGENGDPGTADWLCLDPVSLVVAQRGVTLGDPARLAYDATEDRALRADLAPLFVRWGELVAGQPGHWYLRLAAPLGLELQPLASAVGSAVDTSYPAGVAAAPLRAAITEAQMLLHAHPVNRAREAAGRPCANSLWPWGAGRLPLPAALPFDALHGNDPLLAGLARASSIALSPLDDRAWPERRRILVQDDRLLESAIDFDALRWRAALETLERETFAPALSSLQHGRHTRLRLIAGGPEATVDAQLTRADLWKFWRRPVPLSELTA
jgi:hypothetical protein